MPITEEIRQAAENLGKQLGTEPGVQEYISVMEKIRQDAQLVDLEKRLASLYTALVERQDSGEILDRSETDEYYRLKNQVQDHPLIAAREYQLEFVKAFFAQTAQQITAALGIDYAEFANTAEEK